VYFASVSVHGNSRAREIKPFDDKFLILESLNLQQQKKSVVTSNRNLGKYPAYVGIISDGKKKGR
jgi:hypothetical protein